MKPLIIGLGNDLLSDDAVGILTVRKLKNEIHEWADVIESNLTGIALIDLFIGYEKVIIIDAIFTGKYTPGTIVELEPRDLRSVPNPSPHFTGLPEMLKIADQLGLQFPDKIKILAIEVIDPYTIGGELSKPVANTINELIRRVKSYLHCWEKEVVDV